VTKWHRLAAATAQASATVDQVVGAHLGVREVEAMPAKNGKGIKAAGVPGGVALEPRSWSR